MVHGPERLLILDEPLERVRSLSMPAASSMWSRHRLAADGTSILLLATHDMPSVERLCDEVVMLNGGKVVLSGGADALREAGWSGQQEVVFKGNDIAFTNALGTLGHLDGIGVEPTAGLRRAQLRLRDGVPPGALLRALGEAVEVCEFVKVRPTMESLFIQAVDQTATETVDPS